MTTGEGGMVVTQDAGLAATIRSLRNQGRRAGDDWFEHSDLGYNYRISEMNCALGLSQLRRLPTMLEKRRAVAAEYHRRLRNYSALILPPQSLPERSISWFVYVIRLNVNFDAGDRDRVREYLMERGIGCARYFAPIHLQPAYRSLAASQAAMTVTESEAERTLALPFFNALASEQISEVCEALIDAIRG
jgi:perosamine synthetase